MSATRAAPALLPGRTTEARMATTTTQNSRSQTLTFRTSAPLPAGVAPGERGRQAGPQVGGVQRGTCDDQAAERRGELARPVAGGQQREDEENHARCRQPDQRPGERHGRRRGGGVAGRGLLGGDDQRRRADDQNGGDELGEDDPVIGPRREPALELLPAAGPELVRAAGLAAALQ